jgi:hypothetical protein
MAPPIFDSLSIKRKFPIITKLFGQAIPYLNILDFNPSNDTDDQNIIKFIRPFITWILQNSDKNDINMKLDNDLAQLNQIYPIPMTVRPSLYISKLRHYARNTRIYDNKDKYDSGWLNFRLHTMLPLAVHASILSTNFENCRPQSDFTISTLNDMTTDPTITHRYIKSL